MNGSYYSTAKMKITDDNEALETVNQHIIEENAVKYMWLCVGTERKRTCTGLITENSLKNDLKPFTRVGAYYVVTEKRICAILSVQLP